MLKKIFYGIAIAIGSIFCVAIIIAEIVIGSAFELVGRAKRARRRKKLKVEI